MTEDELINQYRLKYEVNNTYGRSGSRYTQDIIREIQNQNFHSILDYGCGRGILADELFQYGYMVHKYDPAIVEYSALHLDQPDLIITTDVLEHLTDDIIDSFLERVSKMTPNAIHAVFTEVDGHKLPNGSDCHQCVHDREWWIQKLKQYYKIVVPVQHNDEKKQRYVFKTY